MSVGNICSRQVIVANRNEPVQTAIDLMLQYHVGEIVVVDKRDGKLAPIGMLTDRDILSAAGTQNSFVASDSVGELMSTNLLVAKEADDALDVIDRMRKCHTWRVPIVNREDSLTGILGVDDLLAALTETRKSLVRIRRDA